MGRYVFHIYITGNTPKSDLALANLKRICDTYLNGQVDLTIIDVLEQPHLAEEARILATPTLLKVSPPPIRKVIGDLTNIEQVLLGLGLNHEHSRKHGG
jgi:circadian clock protein KaiB